MFDRFVGSSSRLRHAVGEALTGALIPTLDVRESPSEVLVEVELPGVRVEDAWSRSVTTSSSSRARRPPNARRATGSNHVTERSHGSFHRALNVPDSVDQDRITAKMAAGLLTVTLPKRPEAVGASREIEVEAG